jgi:hypothetical protein
MAVLQILRKQTELADSDRHGRGLSNPPILPAYYAYPWFRAQKEERDCAKMVTKFEWIVVVQPAQELSSIPPRLQNIYVRLFQLYLPFFPCTSGVPFVSMSRASRQSLIVPDTSRLGVHYSR